MNIYQKIFFLLLIPTCIYSQSGLQLQKGYADSFYLSGNLFDAITEYKRLLFFENDPEFTFEANFRIAKCYKGGGKFDDALFTLYRLRKNTESMEQIYKLETEIIRLNILRGTTEQAEVLADRLAEKFPEKQYELNYWKGWAFMTGGEWEKASGTFALIDPSHPLKMLCDSVSADKYSVSFARYISYILPGAGHFYTGHILGGMISLGWNILWGYNTVKAFNADRVFDGIMVADFLWLRFYRGGSQEAEKLAEKENLKIENNAYRYLTNKYEGQKP